MLTSADTEYFRGQLLERQDALRRRIASFDNALASIDAYEEAVQERGDDAVFLREHDDNWDQLHFARTELAQIDRALTRIADGTYGLSEVSGKPIPRDRLEAEPTATTLVDEETPEVAD